MSNKDIPDVEATNLEILAGIVERYQDQHRATNKDTSHISEAQQDLHKLIDYYK